MIEMLWNRYLKPLFMWWKCPHCSGAGGFTGGSIPDSEPWSECHVCYDRWEAIEDQGGPEWAIGRLPAWDLAALAWTIKPGVTSVRAALACRSGRHQAGECGICMNCYDGPFDLPAKE